MVFEVPDLEAISANLRFDAVFHQHLHYYDLNSFITFGAHSGLEVNSFQRNPVGSNGGSLLVCLTRKSQVTRPAFELRPQAEAVDRKINRLRKQISRFESMMGLIREEIEEFPGPINIFGAALMLSTLDYHLHRILSSRSLPVYDDDKSKDGLSYKNLSMTVSLPPHSLQNSMTIVGSLENTRGIIRRCFDLGSSKVVAPFIT